MKRLRRTLLYVPGNNPGLINNAGIYGADVIVFDLEDSVGVREKDAARALVAAALGQRELVNPGGAELMVRINGLDTPYWEDDLEAIVPAGVDSIRVPKIESSDGVMTVIARLEELERRHGGLTPVEVSPILETVAGVARAADIASSHPRVTALSFGAEDFTRDLGTSRTKEGAELLHARGVILLAAKAAGVAAIDTVFPDVNDEAGLMAETTRTRGLGFDGKSVIHPRQIGVIHQVFRPSDADIEQALRITTALREAESRGLGVASLDGRMIDSPVARKAEATLALARRLGLAKEASHGA